MLQSQIKIKVKHSRGMKLYHHLLAFSFKDWRSDVHEGQWVTNYSDLTHKISSARTNDQQPQLLSSLADVKTHSHKPMALNIPPAHVCIVVGEQVIWVPVCSLNTGPSQTDSAGPACHSQARVKVVLSSQTTIVSDTVIFAQTGAQGVIFKHSWSSFFAAFT